MLFKFWSTWNYLWYIFYCTGSIKLSNGLKSSVFITSLVGGYIIYIYPKKIMIYIKDTAISIPRNVLIVCDLLFHQLPMFHIFFYNNKCINDSCGLNILIPYSGWLGYNYMNKCDFNKIYGVKIYKLWIGCFSILSGYGMYHHIIQKNKSFLK